MTPSDDLRVRPPGAVALGVIPARYESSRLPGKPLADIGGRPMIQHVYERAGLASSLERVIVATDDPRIAAVVEGFGGEVRMTRSDHPSGTDRVAEAVENEAAELVVNIQGDEPFIAPEAIDQAVSCLVQHPAAAVGTLVSEFTDAGAFLSPNTAKVVLAADGLALYFSRSPIPFCRDIRDAAQWLTSGTYYQHIGLYVYRRDALRAFVQWPEGRLEQLEKLEQLRLLENGHRIVCAKTAYDSFCVDTPGDLELARQMLKEVRVAD